jgi:hypothetical protein
MQDELAARQRAVTLRLAGRPIKAICTALGRSEVWFHKWWRRYLQSGPDGLYDLTRARPCDKECKPGGTNHSMGKGRIGVGNAAGQWVRGRRPGPDVQSPAASQMGTVSRAKSSGVSQ